MRSSHEPIPILYLAPWVDIGGSDKATVDWFRSLDRERFRPSLITTQPSPNRRLSEVAPYAEELWELPQLMAGDDFARFILGFIHTRAVRLVHIMNSNLGFELLPDIVGLPQPPKIVVQLLGEEPGGTGYASYVTTRFGTLVDCFSLCTEALSARLDDYEIPISKRRVIPTAVDAVRDFNPDRIQPIGGLDADVFHILFLARLVEQKDPLLVVEIAAELQKRGLRFQLHVVGDGELADAVRLRIAAAGLNERVLLHGECLDFAPWYAACQAVLLTSRWEGLPSVAYEAMAMRVPLVAPALPGMAELITPDSGLLIAPRDNPEAYAEALWELAVDPSRRMRMGESGRAIVRSRFSLERMAAEHASLYEDLLERAPDAQGSPPRAAVSRALAFGNRRPGMTPLVSVIVPCFNHGRYLPDCLESIAEQTYPAIETVIVDDGSTDSETVEVLAAAEAARATPVVRLAANRGPSAARNAGIERASGRYVLPLDADDLLLPTSVADLVEQLNSADERIGFIYPNQQFFGDRRDYVQMPSYNLHALLDINYCPVSVLIDRAVFDNGFRYPEDIVLGHEDWDFVLTLAEHGIYGEPARTKTLLCRKRGFSRSDLADTNVPFNEIVAARHPSLFARRTAIKAEWNPALTVIEVDSPPEPSDPAPELAANAIRQTCPDFELILGAPKSSRGEVLARALPRARGRYVLAAYGALADLLSDATLVEKLLRILRANPAVAAIVLADAGQSGPPLRLLDDNAAGQAAVQGVCWTATGPAAPPATLSVLESSPLEVLARWLGAHATVQWRHLSGSAASSLVAPDLRGQSTLGAPRDRRAADARFRSAAPELPDFPSGMSHRLTSLSHWRPPQSRLLCRHRDPSTSRYTYTNSTAPPAGHTLEHVLGWLLEHPRAGTTSLVLRDGRQAFAVDEPTDLDNPMLLGFLEQNPLPLFDPVLSGRHPDTKLQTLVAGEDDPLAARLEDPALVGYVRPHRIRPRQPAHLDVQHGLIGFLRTVDLDARRHRYGAGRKPPGVAAGELGALFADPVGDCEGLWIDDDGTVFTHSGAVRNGRPSFQRALRWTREPLTWRSFSRPGPKLRATARRAVDSARVLAWPPSPPSRPARPAGYLLRSATSRTMPLYAALHPVTGDQLLSTDASEGASLGYEEVALLGHLIARAPVTGTLEPIRPGVPWATRFGLVMPRPRHETQLRMRRPSLSELPNPALSPGLSIRAGDESDLAGWAEVMNGEMGFWDAARARWEFWMDPDLLEGGVQLLVDDRGEILGAAAAKRTPTDSRTGYLHMVAVAPRFRGRGLGTAVSLAALRRMADARLDSVVLETDDWRLDAIRTYLRLGFQPDPVAEDHDARWRRILKLVYLGPGVGGSTSLTAPLSPAAPS